MFHVKSTNWAIKEPSHRKPNLGPALAAHVSLRQLTNFTGAGSPKGVESLSQTYYSKEAALN